jgi:hypothetical protein
VAGAIVIQYCNLVVPRYNTVTRDDKRARVVCAQNFLERNVNKESDRDSISTIWLSLILQSIYCISSWLNV